MAKYLLKLWIMYNYGGLYIDQHYKLLKSVTWIANVTDFFAGIPN